VERAMKVQEVIMRAMAKQMTWWQAAEILCVSTRTIRRMKRNIPHRIVPPLRIGIGKAAFFFLREDVHTNGAKLRLTLDE
jgi:hypothetical protein